MVFGQVKTEEKSNEITAIPVLLESIALEGSIVTIDAMGCRYDIADKIVGEKKGDYVFSLKGNQGNLNDVVKEYWDVLDFNKPAKEAEYIKFSTFSTNERGHGLKGRRDYAISDDVEWIWEQFPQWKSIKTIGMIERYKGRLQSAKHEFDKENGLNSGSFRQRFKNQHKRPNSKMGWSNDYLESLLFGPDFIQNYSYPFPA
jgi:predicted transposase YbfD/YdcC